PPPRRTARRVGGQTGGASARSGSPRSEDSLTPGGLRQESALTLLLFSDAGLLADPAAEVVQLGAVDVADLRDLELLDLGRVQRERPLHADAERVLPHGERLARPRALALDHDALVDLDAAPLALD